MRLYLIIILTLQSLLFNLEASATNPSNFAPKGFAESRRDEVDCRNLGPTKKEYFASRVIELSSCVTPAIDSGRVVASCTDAIKTFAYLALKKPTFSFVTAVVGTWLYCQTESSIATIRMCRTLGTVSTICLDYRNVLTKDKFTEQELEECHVRSALKISNLFKKQGGLYIKAGQHLAAMDHILPTPYINRLSELQDQARPMSIKEVNQVFRMEFGKNLDEVFSEFNEEPIGVASIGQVHSAVLKENGQKVAVKVQHLNVEKESVSDLTTLCYAGKMIEFFFPHLSSSHFVKLIQKGIKNELDFHKEAENCKWAKECLSRSVVANRVHVPQVYSNWSSKHILTMEFCPGIKINHAGLLKDAGLDPREVDALMFTVFSEMIFRFNRVHCDPHPGNLLVSESGKLIILDHGLYHDVRPEIVESMRELWSALFDQNEAKLREFAAKNGVPDKVTEYMVSALSFFKEELSKDTPIQEIISKLQKDLKDLETEKLLYETFNSLPADILHVIKVYELLVANERKLLGSEAKGKPSILVPFKYAQSLKPTLYSNLKYRIKLAYILLFLDV